MSNTKAPEVTELLALLHEDWITIEDKKIIKGVIVDMIHMMPDVMVFMKKMIKEMTEE